MPNQLYEHDGIEYWFDDTHPEVLRGLSFGISLERMHRFIRRNQNDYGRMIAGLAGDEGGALYPLAAGYPVQTQYDLGNRSVPVDPISHDPMDRERISVATTSTPADVNQAGGLTPWTGTMGVWDTIRDIGGAIVDVIPGVPDAVVDWIRGDDEPIFTRPTFPGMQLPVPAPRPGVPAPRPSPAPRPVGAGRTPGAVTGSMSPYINPRTGRQIPWSKVAKIGALAATLGLSVEQYIATYGVPRKSPSMNVLNPRALGRAMRRTEGFACFARKAMTFATKYKPGRKSGKCKPRRGRCS